MSVNVSMSKRVFKEITSKIICATARFCKILYVTSEVSKDWEG